MQPKIIKQADGTYVIDGELNMHTVPEAAKELIAILPRAQGEKLTIDLTAVSRSDSAGVALLVDIMQHAKSAKLDLAFSNLPQQMKDIAGISGLLDILPLSEN